ncbi:MAG: hypothetical protein JWN70_1947 [Planctomycetaceae bacterium]|nr:hypothetical protein [Planctomycetaceae bacterium]
MCNTLAESQSVPIPTYNSFVGLRVITQTLTPDGVTESSRPSFPSCHRK